jgi:hypothetical protein
MIKPGKEHSPGLLHVNSNPNHSKFQLIMFSHFSNTLSERYFLFFSNKMDDRRSKGGEKCLDVIDYSTPINLSSSYGRDCSNEVKEDSPLFTFGDDSVSS